MNEIASKTFASQFMAPQNSMVMDPFQRLVVAIKNNRIDVLSTASPEKLVEKDEKGKNLLFYAVYQKSPLALLYLLRAGVPYKELDSENKNLLHFCAYSGSYQCLNTLNNFIKITKIKHINTQFLDLLSKYNYKRTDAKNGKLKYSVSPKRQEAFQELQDKLTLIYSNYLIKTYQNQSIFEVLQKTDQQNQRNPFHLVCLNKYQKCLVTLESMINSVYQPNICLDDKTLEQYSVTDQYFQHKLDPRLYVDTLSLITNFILPENLIKINREFQKNSKRKLQEILTGKDKDQFTPLYLASRNGSTGMINMLKKYEPDTKQEEKQQIMKVASHNLARSHIIDLCDAAKLSDTKPLNFLLSCGDEINGKKTIFGTFALLESIKAFSTEGSIQSTKTLLKNGADINEQDTNGWTVLHHASHLGYKQIVQLLLSSPGVDYNKMTNKRYHSLHLAAISNNPQIIKTFMQKQECKVDINVKDWDGMTPLLHAARKGSLECVKLILDLKGDLYACDKLKMSALHHAAFSNHIKCVKQLLYRDSDEDKLIYMRNSKGKLPKDLSKNTNIFQNIFTAARTSNVNAIRKQIANKAEAKDSITPEKQRTPLIIAVLAKSLPSVRFLIESGADTYHEDISGKSAAQYCEQLLSIAKQNKKKDEIKDLLQIKSLVQ